MQLIVASSGPQLLLSNSLLFRFKSNNEFILEICKVGHLKKNRLSRGNRNILQTVLFLTNVCST